MLSRLIRVLLWLVLHFVYTVVEKTAAAWHHLSTRWGGGNMGVRESFDYVHHNTCHISKLPKHLVYLVREEHLSYVELARLVIWSLAAGVSYFSLYDHTGTLNKNEDKLFKAVQELKASVPGYIKWKNQPELNGCVNGTTNKITVNLLSIEDGKQKIVSVVKNICSDVKRGSLEANSININCIDKYIDNAYSSLPEPNLAIYCGVLCKTNGLLPWHIRLTEFLSLGSPHFNEITFVNVLKKYGHCEQRLGT